MTLCKWTDHEAREWLQTPLGESLLAQEMRVVEEALDGIFGEECLQVGLWGDETAFLRFSRSQRTALVAEHLTASGALTSGALQTGVLHTGPWAIGEPHRLPVASDSVDCVILPHTLDYSDRQHAILREVHRVLRADGQIVLLGFRPGGLWGLRRLIPGAGMPPGANHVISERRLRDWLQLLDMRIQTNTRYFFCWPLPGRKSAASGTWEQRGRRWWPELSACYMLTAQKRISTLTPVRPVWRTQPKVVAGLAEPSTRVSRIRFDQNS